DERLGHAKDGVRCDRRVDGVAALAQDLDARAGRGWVDARDGSPSADGYCFFGGLRRGRSLDAARDEGDEREEHRADETDAHEVFLPRLAGCETRRYARKAASISASASGFSSDDRSPGSAPSAFARTARLTILALRVFGSAPTNRIRSGANAFPSSAVTSARSSATSSSDGSAPGTSA